MMNNYILTLQNMKYMISKKSGIFIATLLSISLCICGMLFFSGYFLWSFYLEDVGTTVEIYLDKNKDNGNKNHHEQLESILNEIEKHYGEILYIRVINENDMDIIGDYNASYVDRLETGEMFSIEEENKAFVLSEWMVDNIVSDIADDEVLLGKTVKAGMEEYQVTGCITMGEYDSCIVPVHYFINHYDVTKIEIGFQKILKSSTIRKLKKYLNGMEIVGNYSVGKMQNPFLDAVFMMQFGQILLIFLAILLNAFGMLYYWTVFFKRNYAIFEVCGACCKNIKKIIRVQTTILLFAGTLIGNIEFAILKSVVSKYDLVYDKDMTVYYILSLIVFLFMYLFACGLAGRIAKVKQIYRTVE